MVSISRTFAGFALLAGVSFTAAGCSDTRLITSERAALTPQIDAVTAARATAASFDGLRVSAPSTAPILSDKAPSDSSNTLVIEDKDIVALDTETSPPRGPGPRWEPSFGAGNECVKNAANVLKFGHFPDDGPHAGAGVCAAWLEKLKYVLVVHLDKRSASDADVDVYVAGNAVLVDLSTHAALGKFTFDEVSKGSTQAVIWTKNDTKGTIVTSHATPTMSLLKTTLADKLVKVFPNADVGGFRPVAVE